MAGLQSGEGRVMIDSVVWAQDINVTDTHTQPRRHSKCRQRMASGDKNDQRLAIGKQLKSKAMEET